MTPEIRGIEGVGSLNFIVGTPTGEFSDTLGDTGFGGNVFGAMRFRGTPFVLGLDVGFLVYGRSRRSVPFSSTVGPSVTVDVVTNNNIVQPHLVFRLQRPDGAVQPYVGVLGGFKYLFTETNVQDDDFGAGRVASTTNFDDFAWSGGAEGGLDAFVYRSKDGTRVGIHVGVQYLLGQNAEYLGEADLIDSNGNGQIDRDELDVRRSRTDLLIPQIGMTVRF